MQDTTSPYNNNDLNDLYYAFKHGQNLGFETQFQPKFMDVLARNNEREIKNETGRMNAGLFKHSQVLGAMQALGYADAASAVTVDGVLTQVYSKEQ